METSKTKPPVKYQIFGSKSSVDLDICLFISQLGSIEENKLKTESLLRELKIKSDKKINANLAIVKSGVIYNCFKGIPDELNNALIATYDLHNQPYPLQIERCLVRNLELKLERCARTIVSYFTRTSMREEAKAALRGNFQNKIHFLNTIELGQFSEFGKHGGKLEIYKGIAFQLGQTLALMNEVEVYTKEEIANEFEYLHDYLFRIEDTSEKLQSKLNTFVLKSKTLIPKDNQH
ncbi:MAG: hypothetical protein AAF487_09030 [Bacteroidota bacterium]